MQAVTLPAALLCGWCINIGADVISDDARQAHLLRLCGQIAAAEYALPTVGQPYDVASRINFARVIADPLCSHPDEPGTPYPLRDAVDALQMLKDPIGYWR